MTILYYVCAVKLLTFCLVIIIIWGKETSVFTALF